MWKDGWLGKRISSKMYPKRGHIGSKGSVFLPKVFSDILCTNQSTKYSVIILGASKNQEQT